MNENATPITDCPHAIESENRLYLACKKEDRACLCCCLSCGAKDPRPQSAHDSWEAVITGCPNVCPQAAPKT